MELHWSEMGSSIERHNGWGPWRKDLLHQSLSIHVKRDLLLWKTSPYWGQEMWFLVTLGHKEGISTLGNYSFWKGSVQLLQKPVGHFFWQGTEKTWAHAWLFLLSLGAGLWCLTLGSVETAFSFHIELAMYLLPSGSCEITWVSKLLFVSSVYISCPLFTPSFSDGEWHVCHSPALSGSYTFCCRPLDCASFVNVLTKLFDNNKL